MNSDSGIQFVAARPRKRPHREISTTPQAHSWSQNGESSNSTPRPSVPPHRYPGDGLDLRRPITTSPPPADEVIDLTNEPDSPDHVRQASSGARTTSRRPRPPRFGRDIMADVVDLEDEEPEPPSSPEVQFVSATVRQQPPQPPPRNGSLLSSNFWRMLSLPHRGFMTPGPLSHGEGFRRQVPWGPHHFTHPELLETLWLGDGPGGAIDLTINLDVDAPLNMDYVGQTPERGRPRSSYKPPSPPPEGFTRSVEENDIVCCPNCDSELGIGDEVKQQIWVVKQCGHVYCGECATNRSLAKAKKSSSKTKPFSKCQVPGCDKSISSRRALFQVYL